MRVTPRSLWCHRSGKWQQIMSDEVFPGDVIMISRDKTKHRNPNIKKK